MGVKPIHRAIQKQLRDGYTLHVARSNHVHVLNPAGKYVYSLPLTPSSAKSMRNNLAGMRRLGLLK